jgi:phage terminase large subunit-like protein
VKHPQGFRRSAKVTEKEINEGKEDIQLWMPQSVNNFEALIVEEQIIIKRNPVVAWAASCTVLEADAQGNRKFAKHKATGRIDPMVAAAQAIGLATEKFAPQGNLDDFINNPIMIGV